MTITFPDLMEVPPGLGEVEWFDGFCGAGGSSLGIEHVPGFKVTCALNHWDLAVLAHNANFPHADHDLHDVEHTHPRRFRRTRCAWFSPECVHHASCRGKKATTEEAIRSRMTMWDVTRYSEWHRYDAVIVENVVEAMLWPDFFRWINTMHWLGYDHKIVFFNSQFALTPQSRDRMYVVFWRKGIPAPDLDFTPPAWCEHCESVALGQQRWKKASKGGLRDDQRYFEWGRYGSQYVYACPNCSGIVAPAVLGAKTIIDWADTGLRIGDREANGLKPLALKTRQRIITGLQRLATTEPIAVQVGGHLYERPGYARVWSVDDPLRTVTGTPYMALVSPMRDGNVGQSIELPANALTGRSQLAAVIPNMTNNIGRSVDEPIGAVTSGNRHMILRMGGQAVSPRSTDEPSMTITAHDRQVGFLLYNGVPGFVRSLEDAAGTITARDKQSLLVPYYGTAKTGRRVDVPMGTITAKDRAALVITEADVDDCMFRMIQWPELLRAQMMHRRPDGSDYELTAHRVVNGKPKNLSNEQRTKMIGNAVSAPVATMLGMAVAESLARAA